MRESYDDRFEPFRGARRGTTTTRLSTLGGPTPLDRHYLGRPRGFPGDPVRCRDLDTRLAQLRHDAGLTAAAAAVITGGRFAAAAACGERRRRSAVPVTINDRWHIGSITKSMTATLLAVLEDDGRLCVNDRLPALLPDVEMAGGWSACTLHHLLTHTAGAPANFPLAALRAWPDTAEELVSARRRFIAGVLARAPRSPCGERFAYSNVGYTIAGHIAETACGMPYETLMRDRVFGPLGLASAGFGPPKGVRPGREPVGHAVWLRWIRSPKDPFETRADNTPVIAPAGCAHMTITDLARYGTAHLEGASDFGPSLLPQPAWERLHTPFLDDYASGWVRYESDRSGSVLLHNGSNTLWYALLVLVPSRSTVLAFATNDGAIRRAETAFSKLVRELVPPAEE